MLDVTNPPAGSGLAPADKTGATDCRAAVQALAEYAAANGYGGLFFPTGNYGFSRSAATSGYTENTSIDINDAGLGAGATFVLAGTGPGTRLFPLVPGERRDRDFLSIRNTARKIVIRDLMVDGRYSETKAYQILSFTGIPAAGGTVTIGARTYTFRSTLTGAANEVLIGGTAAATHDNMLGALQASTTGGQGPNITYGAGTTAHTQVTATVGATGTTIDLISVAHVVTYDADEQEWLPDGLLLAATYTASNVAFTASGGGGDSGGGFVDSQPEQWHCIAIGESGSTSTGVHGVSLLNVHATQCRGDAVNVSGNNTPRAELTISANPANAETFTLDVGGPNQRVYTWVSSLVNPNDILIGPNAAASRDNAVEAINGVPGGGYHPGTLVHLTMQAQNGAGNNLVVNSKAEGEALDETMINGSWGTATLVNIQGVTDELILTSCRFYDTFRTCFGVQRGLRKLVMTGCILRTGRRGCFDMEPTGVSITNDSYGRGNSPQQFVVAGNIFERRTEGATIATLIGISTADRADYSIFSNNLCLGGGIAFLGSGPMIIDSNIIVGNNRTDHAGGPDSTALIYCRRSQDLVINNNYLERPTTPDGASGHLIHIFDSADQAARRIKIANNICHQHQNKVLLNIAGGEDIDLEGNHWYFWGTGSVHGLILASSPGAIRRVRIVNEKIRGHMGSGRLDSGIRISAPDPQVDQVYIDGIQGDGVADGVRFSGMPDNFINTPFVGNLDFTDVTGLLVHLSTLDPPAVQRSGDRGRVGHYEGNGKPDFPAQRGATYSQRDGSGTNDTFWVNRGGSAWAGIA